MLFRFNLPDLCYTYQKCNVLLLPNFQRTFAILNMTEEDDKVTILQAQSLTLKTLKQKEKK
jgi:hypothetical protein